MELFEQLFKDVMEFNDYMNIRLIEDRLVIIPISVVPVGKQLWIFYTREELE